MIHVIGDSCTDEFIYGKVTRINPEAPTPVFVANGKVKSNLGMAGNTFLNISSLYGSNNVVNLIRPKIQNIKKVRYVDDASNYIILRVDEEPKIQDFDRFDTDEYISSLKGVYPKAIVISDYCKGFLSEREIIKLASWCNENKIITFLDTKKILTNDWTFGLDYIKINETEFEASSLACGICNKYRNIGSRTTLIKTLGSKGCSIVYRNKKYENTLISTQKVEVRDVSGAGDTFLAALAVSITDNRFNGDLIKCCEFANKAAGYACTQTGVVVVKESDFSL